MTVKHPVFHLLASVLAEASCFSFTVLFLLRPTVRELNVILLLSCLLLLAGYDYFLLRNPISVAKYIGLNLIPAAAFAFLAFRIPVMASFEITTYLWYYLFLSVLIFHRIYISCFPPSPASRILSVDGLIVLFILTRIWYHFSPGSGTASLSLVVAAALLAGLSCLAVSRLTFPSLSSRQTAAPVIFLAVILLLFTASGAAALIWGEGLSSALVSAALFVFHLIKTGLLLLLRGISAFILWFASLFPESAPGELPPYELPPSIQAIMEQEDPTVDLSFFVFLGVIGGIALLTWFIYKVFHGNMLNIKTGGRTTAKNERRTFHLFSFFQAVFRRFVRFFYTLWMLIFCGSTVPSLLFRAEWYGRRHLHSRKKGETIREYLLRLDRLHDLGDGSALLCSYAEQYFYSPENPRISRENLRRIKKAFPFL